MQTDQPDTLPLPPVLDASTAEDLSNQLRDRVLAGLPLVVDAARVERAATLPIQALAAAFRAARARGVPFHLNAPTPTLLEAIRSLGLHTELAVEGQS